MGADAKAAGDGFEHLLFLGNALTAPPPPSLVDERPVGRVHEPDNAVVNVARKLGRQMSDAVAWAESGQARTERQRVLPERRAPPRMAIFRVRDVDPDVAVPLFAREARGEDSVHPQLVAGGE